MNYLDVEVDGHNLSFSNLDKILYPDNNFTKASVIEYYSEVSQVMLPHLQNRCVTTRRWPDGILGESFFQKNCPKFHPDWVDVFLGPGSNDGKEVNYCLVQDKASLLWLANLAALEFHTPMSLINDLTKAQSIVFDLDPGENFGLKESCQVALKLRDLLSSLGLECFAKTSGGKGLAVYIPINGGGIEHEYASRFAKGIGLELQKSEKMVILDMSTVLRKNKIFIDWSQNSFHKTTICVYSLRGRSLPYISTPITWQEVKEGAEGLELFFLPNEVLSRVKLHGDLFSEVLTMEQNF